MTVSTYTSLPALLALSSFAAASPCPPSALLEGDAGLVEAMRVELSKRGILELAPGDRCLRTRVRLELERNEIAVDLELEDGTHVVRVEPDVATAATFIESWVRPELLDPLLGRRVAVPDRAPVRPPPEASKGDSGALGSPSLPEPRPFSFGANGTLGFGNDGSTWVGFDLHGCFLVWQACFGGRVAYALDANTGGHATNLGAERSLLELEGTVDLPWAMDGFEITPGLSVGQAIVRSERDVGKIEVMDDTGGLRLGFRTALAWRSSERWALRVEGAIALAPNAQRTLRQALVEGGPENVLLPGEVAVLGWIRAGVEMGGL